MADAPDWELATLVAITSVLSEKPFYGYRRITKELRKAGVAITEKQVRRLMHQAGLRALYPKRNMSRARAEHLKYPYLLRGKKIWLPNQVWATDITYLKLARGGCAYLVAIMDLYSRKVLSYRISNTADASFCVEALLEALERYGTPAIFNSDQGSQFTCEAFTGILNDLGVRISMDSTGRALDNVFVERMWRSLKYEQIYLNEYESMPELKASVERYYQFYNSERFHQSLEYRTPDEVYYDSFQTEVQEQAA